MRKNYVTLLYLPQDEENANYLAEILEEKHVEVHSFEKMEGRLAANIDGFLYANVRFDGSYTEEVALRGKYAVIPTYGENIGMFLNSIDEETIKKWVYLGEGMELSNQFPGKEIKVENNNDSYDSESELIALDCSVDGKKETELLIGTYAYAKSGHINYDEEVLEYLKNKSDKMAL